jgi:hypothetical protein
MLLAVLLFQVSGGRPASLLRKMLTYRATAITPSGLVDSLIAPTSGPPPPAASLFQTNQTDVGLSAHYRVIANGASRYRLKLSTSPPSIDLPREGRLFHTCDLDSVNRFLHLLDQKIGDKTWKPHQEAYTFRQFVPDSPDHAYYIIFFATYPRSPAIFYMASPHYPLRISPALALLPGRAP